MIDLGTAENRNELETLVNKVAMSLKTIRENKIPLATDWAWSELFDYTQRLTNFLTKSEK